MDLDCPEARKEEGGNFSQIGEDVQIQINLAEEDTYIDLEGFYVFFLGVEGKLMTQSQLTSASQGLRGASSKGLMNTHSLTKVTRPKDQ